MIIVNSELGKIQKQNPFYMIQSWILEISVLKDCYILLSLPVLIKFIYCTKAVLCSNILWTICCIFTRCFMLEICIISSTSDVKTYVIFLIMTPTQVRKKERATTITFMNTLARPIKALVSKPYMFFYVATMQEYLYCQHSSMNVANTEV